MHNFAISLRYQACRLRIEFFINEERAGDARSFISQRLKADLMWS